MRLNSYLLTLLAFSVVAVSLNCCDSIFGSKSDRTIDEIFEEGRQDPDLIVDDRGYVALQPFWTGFDQPTDVFIGFDELVYVTDAEGLHVLDRAGRHFRTIPLRGATAVTQDRMLDVYVAARIDTVITAVDPDITWDLPAVYKIRNANGAGPLEFVQTIVHPFADASRPTTATQRFRLDRSRSDNDELVSFSGLTVLANNTVYVTRKGPRNISGQAQAPDNTVLIFTPLMDDGMPTGQMRNTSQIRALSATTPSLMSGIQLNDIQSFIAPPQRDTFTSDQSFMVAQGAPDMNIPFRVLWVSAVETPDGLVYRPNSTLLQQDTTRADRFMYEQNRFVNPTGIAYDLSRSHIFVTDAGTDSLYMFQSSGVEGVNPMAGSARTRVINVSFGGTGNGPREFNNPGGVAYYRQVVYVADTGNNRISRFKLNTDF